MNRLKLKILLVLLSIAVFSISSFGISKNDSNADNQQNSVKLQKYFYKRFDGNIGKYPIVMNLIRSDTLLEGSYYYKNKGRLIHFTRTSKIDTTGNFFIGENTGKYDSTWKPIMSGIFRGRFITIHELGGIWTNPKTKEKFNFLLKEDYPAGSVKCKFVNHSKHLKLDSGSASITFQYPVITNLNETVRNKINKHLKNHFLKVYNLGDEKINYKSFDEIFEDFFTNFKKINAELKGFQQRWDDSFTYDILYNSDSILSLRTTEFRFEGGAHPNTFFNRMNFDLKTGKLISVKDIFKPNYKSKLNKLGEIKIRKFYHLSPNTDLNKAGFFLKDDKFEMNNNFSIIKAGLIFQFNQYEIANYAMGAPSISFPYSEIKNILKKKSIISKLVK